MNECLREQEALDLVRAGRWPHGCDEEMRAHIEACASCGASVKLASMIGDDYHRAVRTARVPSSGLVWWRAQRRARAEAARAAARVVTIVQGVVVAVGVGAAVAIAGTDNVASAVSFASTQLLSHGIVVAIAITAWFAIAPVAVYFAVGRD